MFARALVCILLFIFDVHCMNEITEPYAHHVTLNDGNVKLYWKFTETNITFEVHGRTTGWIGIGFSTNGGMESADMIIGWVKDGKVKVTDRHGIGNTIPPLDPEQNIDVIGGSECDGWTMFKFSRQLASCEDEYDMEITQDTVRLIWAHSGSDPADDNMTRSDYHGSNRGTNSMYFLGSDADSQRELPDGPVYKTFDILAQDFEIPSSEFYYNCRIYKMPDVGKKHHVVKLEPIITEGNEQTVHHMLIYRCGDKPKDMSEIGMDARCYLPSMAHFSTCVTTIIAWGIGGESVIYPEEAGLSIGGEDDPIYIQLEVHYDNPQRKAGVRDSSGIRLTYTDTLREHDIGVLYVGNAVIPTQQFIPPGAESFLNVGFCYPECLESGMVASGIDSVTVFGVLLHSHLAGRALKLRHFRGEVENPHIASDDSYDFNYQQTRILSKYVTLMPNDTMRMECVYDTSDRTEVTESGFGTKDEMCIAFVNYYPRIMTSSCASSVSAGKTWPYFGIDLTQLRYIPDVIGLGSFYLAGPEKFKGKTLKQVLSQYNWTEENIDKLEKNYLKMDQQSICVQRNRDKANIIELPIPTIKSEYVTPVQTCDASATPMTTQMKDAMTCAAATTQASSTTTSTTDSTTSDEAAIKPLLYMNVLLLGVSSLFL